MTTVGIRELRQRASQLLRLVEAGETVEITDRGRPVAVLAPIRGGELERLRNTGEAELAAESLSSLPAPLDGSDHALAPSEVLARLRHDER